jgi:hypothetical protein
MTIRLILTAFVTACFFAIVGLAQADPRGKSHTLHGSVEAVNGFAESIRVNQEKIDGYSMPGSPRTMWTMPRY